MTKKKPVGPSKAYTSRTQKAHASGVPFGVCAVDGCERVVAWRCQAGHQICAACVKHDPAVKKMGRRCPICGGDIVAKLADS